MANNDGYSSAGEGTQKLDQNQVVQWQTYGRVPQSGDLVDSIQAATSNELSVERLDRIQQFISTRFDQIMNMHSDSIEDTLKYGSRITRIYSSPNHPILNIIRRSTGSLIAERVLLEDVQQGQQLSDGDLVESYKIPYENGNGNITYKILFDEDAVGNKRILLTNQPNDGEENSYEISRYDLTSFEMRRIEEIEALLEKDVTKEQE